MLEPWLRGLSNCRQFAKQPPSIARVHAGFMVGCNPHSLVFQTTYESRLPERIKNAISSYDDLQDRNPCILPGIMKQKRMVRSVQHCVIPPSLDAILLI